MRISSPRRDRSSASRALAALAVGVGLIAVAGQALAADPTPSALEPGAAWSLPSDADIGKVLAERVDVRRQATGIVVGVIDASGRRRIIAHGVRDQGDTRPLDGDTVFEIGSMTKVFTSLLLADAVRRGEVALDDPAAKYLPAGVNLPERGGRKITLIDLATHTSGLPRLPANMSPADPANPYADYTVDQLYRFLGSYELTRDIGAQYEYSNLGAGLLGHLLARRSGGGYEALVRQRITGPLGMTSTAITLSPGMRARLARGHDEALRPVANWDLPTLAGAGALRSTANDMLVFLAAELGEAPMSLKQAMELQLAHRRPIGSKGAEVALGWHILHTPMGEVAAHNGGTGGYRSFMAFDADRRVAVVVLANTATNVDDIGLHVLNGSPLSPAPVQRHAVPVPAATLETYVGRYRLTPSVVVTITRDGERLFAQATGQAVDEIFAEGPRDFFWRGHDRQMTFQAGPDGHAGGIILHQDGQTLAGTRIP